MRGKGGIATRKTNDERRAMNDERNNEQGSTDSPRRTEERRMLLVRRSSSCARRSPLLVSALRSSPVVRRLSVLLDDGDLELRSHIAMQLDRDCRLAEGLDGVGQLDLAAVDVEALDRQCLRDIGG